MWNFFKLYIAFFLAAFIFAGSDDSLAEVMPSESVVKLENNSGHHITPEQRRILALSFVKRMKGSLLNAEAMVNELNSSSVQNMLPDGEMVLMQVNLRPHLLLEGLVSGLAMKGKIFLSLRDFSTILEFPIDIDDQANIASGSYIRVNKEFFIDVPNKVARTDNGKFTFDDNVISQDGDIFVDVKTLAEWLNFKIETNIAIQQLNITSAVPLPIQDRYNRRKGKYAVAGNPSEAKLERKDDPYKVAEVPFVDVTTNSTLRRRQGKDALSRHTANIRTTGDFGKGTLTTLSQVNDKDRLNNVRVNFKRESDKPELLGKLNARKFELGDVITTSLPVGGGVRQEFGASMTNSDTNKGTRSPTTTIEGSALPGWDVELYRNDQIVGFQEVDENGHYQFDQVLLFLSENKFRLLFYGPQGEVVEESLFVPVDSSRLANGKGVYNVSLTLNEEQTYVKNVASSIEDEDKGTPNLAASYEHSLGAGTTGVAGFRSSENNGVRNYVANAGVTKVAYETLLNADVGVDDEGEFMSELSARRSLGDHDISERLTWTGANYDTQLSSGAVDESLVNDINIVGPLPLKIGNNARYSAGAQYSKTNGNDSVSAGVGFSTSWKALSLSQEFGYDNQGIDGDNVRGATNISGAYGRNRLRVGSNYTIKPDSELVRVLANYRRVLNKDLDIEAEANRQFGQDLTEYSAKLDWQAGFIRLSPSVTYNTNKDFYAGLRTRFGLLREPHKNDIRMYDRNISSNGAVSAFVYLDKNGNSIFDEGEEAIPEVIIQMPQNGGRERTDENGIAMFPRLREAKATDVFIDVETLQDPSWVSGFNGISVLPRAGHIATVEFPIHMAGEIDGVVYLREPGKEAVPLKNIALNLYNYEGKLEQKVVTDIGGFYYYTRIPPGRYLLIVDEDSARRGNFIRPEPQNIEIGYDGTVMYGNDIMVDAGKEDVPSIIMADLEDYKLRHPQIDFSNDNYDLVLNLGDYNSNVLMSVIWYKLRTRYASIVSGSKIFVPPSESYADVKTGKHTLRVGLKNDTIDGAYRRCRALMARDQYCKVEIYPAYMKQAKVEDEGPLITLPQ